MNKSFTVTELVYIEHLINNEIITCQHKPVCKYCEELGIIKKKIVNIRIEVENR